jgi:hypothetical protein
MSGWLSVTTTPATLAGVFPKGSTPRALQNQDARFQQFGQVRKQLRPSAANRSHSLGAFNALDFRLLSAAIVGQFITE